MAKYRVIPEGKVWLHFPSKDGPAPRMFKAEHGVFEYAGWPNAFMEPVDAEAKETVKLLEELRAQGGKLPDTPAEARAKAAPAAESKDDGTGETAHSRGRSRRADAKAA